jgi:hypothetical protein
MTGASQNNPLTSAPRIPDGAHRRATAASGSVTMPTSNAPPDD